MQAAGQVLVRTPERGPYRVVELIDRQSPLAVSNGSRLRPVPQTEFYTAGRVPVREIGSYTIPRVAEPMSTAINISANQK